MNDPSASDFRARTGLSPTAALHTPALQYPRGGVRGWPGTAVAISEQPHRRLDGRNFTSSGRRIRTRCGRWLAISPAMRWAIVWCLAPSRRARLGGAKPRRAGAGCGRGGLWSTARTIATALRQNRIGVEIEAGLAFGTGHHGTTLGCLMALDRMLNRRRPAAAFLISAAGPACSPSPRPRAGRPGGRSRPATLIPSAFGWAARQNARLNRAGAPRRDRSGPNGPFPTAACRRRLIWCSPIFC